MKEMMARRLGGSEERLPMAEVLRQCGSAGLMDAAGVVDLWQKTLRLKRQERQKDFRVVAQLNPRSHHA